MSETKRLGRGLEALLGPVSREQAEASGALRELPIASVLPNPFQPRTHWTKRARPSWPRRSKRPACCSRSSYAQGTESSS